MQSVLAIGGSDSSGGAGIQADIKTISYFGVYATTVITALTAQNTLGVQYIYSVPSKFILNQMVSIIKDIKISAIKIGMLNNHENINIINNVFLKHYKDTPIILDPIMYSTSGKKLLKKSAYHILIKKLITITYVITPNIPEAEILSGIKITNIIQMKQAAKKIHSLGARNVLIKGGHLKGDIIKDIFYDGVKFKCYSKKRINSKNTHGTGCTLASAITACVALGFNINESIDKSQKYLYDSIKFAPKNIGRGQGPLNHFLDSKLIKKNTKVSN